MTPIDPAARRWRLRYRNDRKRIWQSRHANRASQAMSCGTEARRLRADNEPAGLRTAWQALSDALAQSATDPHWRGVQAAPAWASRSWSRPAGIACSRAPADMTITMARWRRAVIA